MESIQVTQTAMVTDMTSTAVTPDTRTRVETIITGTESTQATRTEMGTIMTNMVAIPVIKVNIKLYKAGKYENSAFIYCLTVSM